MFQHARGTKITLVHVPGHDDLEGNELADKNSKEAANQYNDSTPLTKVTLQKAKLLIRHRMVVRWQNVWDMSDSGRELHRYQPNVPVTKYKFNLA